MSARGDWSQFSHNAGFGIIHHLFLLTQQVDLGCRGACIAVCGIHVLIKIGNQPPLDVGCHCVHVYVQHTKLKWGTWRKS